MVISIFIVADRAFLNALLGHLQRNVDQAVCLVTLRGKNAQFHGI